MPPLHATEKPTRHASVEREMPEVEAAVIGVFVAAVKLLGMPKSVGEIYGQLYIAPDPLPLDALVERLGISKGSASQGLKMLRAVGAVKLVYVAGDRRDHYAAETELKKLVAGFIREEVRPRLESGSERLVQLRALADAADPARAEFYRSRVSKLAQWHARGQAVLPLVTGLLD